MKDNSVYVNAGSFEIADEYTPGWSLQTTREDQEPDTDEPDMGAHYEIQ